MPCLFRTTAWSGSYARLGCAGRCFQINAETIGDAIDEREARNDRASSHSWGPTTLIVDIYSSNLDATFTNGSASHGALLATASIALTDVGLAFYDVPIAFAFLAGNRYDVAFRGNVSFGTSDGVNIEFYNYHFGSPGGPYAAGPVSVVDGACHGLGCSDYSNTVMPHV